MIFQKGVWTTSKCGDLTIRSDYMSVTLADAILMSEASEASEASFAKWFVCFT